VTASVETQDDELNPGHLVSRLRTAQGLTQGELAQRVGTQQSSIARLESGNTQPSLSFLHRVAEALGGRLEVRIVLPNEVSSGLSQASTERLPSPHRSVRAPVWQFPEMD
jgi:transcriptional regulator with XRE-family HTH domain